MKISYVLPVYNAQNTINQCLNSILNQNIEPHEVIVIDDASTDNTMRIISHVMKESPLITVIENEDRTGAAKSRNYGNSIATGEVIAVCDADFYEKNRSLAIKEFFEKEKDKSVFYSALHLRAARSMHEQCVMEAYEWDFKSKCPISHPTVAYKKCVTEEVRYHEDSKDTDLYEFFLLDAHKKGYLFGGCQNPLMTKIEGDTKRDADGARKLKAEKYKSYGIALDGQ